MPRKLATLSSSSAVNGVWPLSLPEIVGRLSLRTGTSSLRRFPFLSSSALTADAMETAKVSALGDMSSIVVCTCRQVKPEFQVCSQLTTISVMGTQTHLRPKTEFAHRLNAFFRAQVDERGWDASGRKMESLASDDEPRRSVWAKFYADTQAMNTNEIAIAARIFEMTPFEFVNGARHLEGSFSVGGSDEDDRVLSDEEEQELRRSDVDLAALRGRNEAEIPHAE